MLWGLCKTELNTITCKVGEKKRTSSEGKTYLQNFIYSGSWNSCGFMLLKGLLSCSHIYACDFQNIHPYTMYTFEAYWCLYLKKQNKICRVDSHNIFDCLGSGNTKLTSTQMWLRERFSLYMGSLASLSYCKDIFFVSSLIQVSFYL